MDRENREAREFSRRDGAERGSEAGKGAGGSMHPRAGERKSVNEQQRKSRRKS